MYVGSDGTLAIWATIYLRSSDYSGLWRSGTWRWPRIHPSSPQKQQCPFRTGWRRDRIYCQALESEKMLLEKNNIIIHCKYRIYIKYLFNCTFRKKAWNWLSPNKLLYLMGLQERLVDDEGAEIKRYHNFLKISHKLYNMSNMALMWNLPVVFFLFPLVIRYGGSTLCLS